MRKTVAVALAVPLAASPLLAIGPASAQSVVKERVLEKKIERGFKKQAKTAVTVNCPANVTWVKGKVFYCRAKRLDGSKVLIKVKLGKEVPGLLTWKALL